jgi:hypothetical protein
MLDVIDYWSRQSCGKIGNPSKQAKGNARKIKDIIESFEEFKSLGLWVESIVVFSNYDVELDLNDPTVEIMKPYELPNYLVSYRKNGYNFSSKDLELMANQINRQTS